MKKHYNVYANKCGAIDMREWGKQQAKYQADYFKIREALLLYKSGFNNKVVYCDFLPYLNCTFVKIFYGYYLAFFYKKIYFVIINENHFSTYRYYLTKNLILDDSGCKTEVALFIKHAYLKKQIKNSGNPFHPDNVKFIQENVDLIVSQPPVNLLSDYIKLIEENKKQALLFHQNKLVYVNIKNVV